jgi:hypothetical protein
MNLSVALALSALFHVGCVSYVLGPTDTQKLQDNMVLQESTYSILANDGGPPPANLSLTDLRRIRGNAKVGYCNERDILKHSGITLDGGLPCEAAP